ncbi:MAG: response regulator transcription factor [Propioniciclava sp.]|uniref:response regulator n=1 Tax=Propioniciclava sp. TaxID=2038686 RepID=UPI0039E4F7DB
MQVVQHTRRILIVEDHGVLAELIANAIDDEAGWECAGIADDLDSALASADLTRPDTIILDAQLPSGDGVQLVPRLRALVPGVRVIILTARPRPDHERTAFEAGAVGYLGKDGRLADLITAIREATPEDPARDRRLQERSDAASLRSLSRREREVLGLLAEGRHVQDIATQLGLSVSTTRGYVKAILAKFGAQSQLEAVAAAAREGLVRVG